MFRGSGPGGVQTSSFEHLRGPIYLKLNRIEAKGGVGSEWKVSGPARAAGGRNSDFIRGFSRILQIEDRGLQPGFNTPRDPKGAADLQALPLPPTHLGAS